MNRSARLALPVLLLALAGCCTTCQTPWDYCNAVLGPGGCPNCDFGARYGSLFHPMYGTPAATPLTPTPADSSAEPVEPAAPDEYAPAPAYDDPFPLEDDSAF